MTDDPDAGVATSQLTAEQRLVVRQAAARLGREFAGVFGPETIERYIEDSQARLEFSARFTNWLPVLIERFTRDRLQALAKTEGLTDVTNPTVLFLCVHNAGRSQMAAGFTRHLSDGRVDVYSGGSDPGSEVNPSAIEAMAEVGIDIRTEFPKPWTDEMVGAADVVVTMGCGDACPILPGKRYLDWELDDPAGQSVDAVRPIRDEIEQRVRGLLAELGVAVPS